MYSLLATEEDADRWLSIVTAHSNWCELTLQSMGHREVFAHVGRNVTVHAPNGQNVPILVTGTFGGNDFIHSLLGMLCGVVSCLAVTNKIISALKARPAII